MRFKYTTNSPSQTKKLGEVLAKKIIQSSAKKKHAKVFGLIGDLGGGKTTFLQGFAKGLTIKEKILSPTFVIIKKYKIPRHQSSLTRRRCGTQQNTPAPEQSLMQGTARYGILYHVDCYRIQKTQEILDLGFKKMISDQKNIVTIEWADRIRRIMPKDTTWIYFDFIDEKRRKIRNMVK
ncbi:tRNA (adenosine(37)-N6)-threonylcarbamoyltransferase complex ATPase subunit type 1 TsaE [Patescibacteria group bacterium]|nr:tRNA (adenosine(37)-N6)-threonylcarbamoyltransferase complex ATPase subunit type 1 TsaE [Patescibacteria group bacterium]